MRTVLLSLQSIVGLVALVGLSACTTIDPAQKAGADGVEGEIKALQDDWNQDSIRFLHGLFYVVGKVRLLTSHPGRPDMVEIITAFYSRVCVEGQEDALGNGGNALFSLNR